MWFYSLQKKIRASSLATIPGLVQCEYFAGDLEKKKKKDTQIHSFTYFIIYSKIKRFVYHLVHQIIAVKVIIYTKSRILRLFSSLKSNYFKWEDMYSDFRKQISLLISSICGQRTPV